MSEIRDEVIKEMVDIISGKKYVAGSHFDEYELALSLLGIRGLAIVDRGVELPEFNPPYHIKGTAVHIIAEEWHKKTQQDMLKAGWVKEVI